MHLGFGDRWPKHVAIVLFRARAFGVDLENHLSWGIKGPC